MGAVDGGTAARPGGQSQPRRGGGGRGCAGVFDDDCVPEPEVVAAYDRFFFEHGEVGAAEGRISPERPRQRMDEVAPINHSGGRFWSCNVAVRATVFERLGGFDERFPYPAMEDVEFHRRLLLAGVNPVFVPSAGVVHPWRKHGGWEWLRRQAIAHGIYARLDSADLRRIPLHVAIKRTWHHWRHEVLPGFKRYRGRGWQAPVRETLLPFWCDLEMRRAVKLPKLELWSPALRSKP